MVRIAFNIPRRNWYRVLAAPVNEALRRGWDVTCLHGSEEHKPQREIPLPIFSKMQEGLLSFKEYQGISGFKTVLNEKKYDVVVDIGLIPRPITEFFERNNSKPLTVLLEGITHPCLQSGIKFPNFDLYLVPSQWHIDNTIKIMTRDHLATFSQAESKLGWIAKKVIADWKAKFAYRWSEQEATEYREKSIAVGTPSLDDLGLIDRSEVRKRWGIPEGIPVVGLFPSPYDMPLGYFWGDLNMVENSIGLLRVAMLYKQLKQLPYLNRVPKDKEIVRAISDFSKNNGALFIAKMRKHRRTKKHLASCLDLVIGEDSFFPHSSLELFAISDLCFGFCTSGSFECIAAGTPYIDINIPFFPKNELIQLCVPSLEVNLPWSGVTTEMEAENLVKQLPSMSIEDFTIDNSQRTAYLDYFTSETKGDSSAKMMEVILNKLNNR